jgi:hypothetical protein
MLLGSFKGAVKVYGVPASSRVTVKIGAGATVTAAASSNNGGPDPTGFADGQASVTGEVRQVAVQTDNTLRLSLGAAAWGGAQKGAQRIDIGPTLRFDVTLGEVPARLSVDWRERVGGDAGPDSGLAATLSTRF